MKKLILACLIVSLADTCTTAQAQCNGISRKVDKFSGETHIYTSTDSPLLLNVVVDVARESSFYLSLSAPARPDATSKGVIVLFSDRSRSTWPNEEVEIEVGDPQFPGWGYTHAKTFIPLEKDELLKYSQKRVTDYKLNVYPLTLRAEVAEKFMNEVGCLVDELRITAKK